jgi:carbon monoxide dehydrogenase subunit G
MVAARTEVSLERLEAGTRVTVSVRQQMRGTARFGGFLVRRATRHQVDEALEALEGLHGA